MTSNLDSFAFSVDRAYVRAHNRHGLEGYGGKFAHIVKTTEILWDDDVQPTGLAAAWQTFSGRLTKLRPSGFFYLINNPSGGDTARAAGGQLLAAVALGGVDVEVAAGLLWLADIDSLAAESPGNSVSETSPGSGEFFFTEDYRVVDTNVSAQLTLGSWPITVNGQVIVNPGADDDNLGFHVGVKAGTTKNAGDWQLKYAFADIKRDAVLAALAQDDYVLQTNYRVHDVQAGVGLGDSIALTGRAYLVKLRSGDDDATPGVDEGQLQVRVRLDLDVAY
jgi:hypothetical protein